MNIQELKRLLELETQLSARTERRHQAARAQVPDSPGDVGDVSVADQGESEAFTEAELSSDARNGATFATSSGRPRRPRSVLPSIAFAQFGS